MAAPNQSFSSLEESCKKLLHSTIFLGNYTERRWVPHLNRYKDVIILSPSETELRKKLFKLRMDVHENYEGIKTSNIVLAADFTMIYSNLPFGCPFGSHWFKIRHVKVEPNERDVIFTLKIVRSVDPRDFNDSSKGDLPKPADEPEMIWSDALQRLKFAFTVSNVIQFFRITLLVIMTIVMGTFVAIKSTATFLLTFTRECSIFVRSATPFLLGTSNVISKIFGGFFILLSMVWKDIFYLARRKIDPDGTPVRPPDRPQQAQLPAISFYGSQYNTPVTRNVNFRQRRYGGGVKITELPD
ncbi:uncharacterized protein LOC132198832 [Neocloeon triangulifer]|uniref:uncharacterized protein LOC132198832 n=1 Tax=Neocloeon triangulifer TaxID=2078957 RepID=UPI00286F3A86|nr:uncharacterized protein LOC132198832 [Neocloeon triangulifer]